MRIKYVIIHLIFLVLFSGSALAQEKNISGNVTDQYEQPLPGVNVLVKGTTTGTQTDFDGNFIIGAEEGQTLVFTYIGQRTEERSVEVSNVINVQMTEDAETLEEVVVTGYGSKSRELSTSAVSTVSTEKIEAFVPSTSIDNILQGQASGVQVTAANGRPGQTAFVQIRGVGSINASTTPLYVIDGVPLSIDDANNINPLSNINPNDIESFSILKDAATVSKYGSRGANGVVLITTKQGKSGDAKITFRSSYGFGQRTPDPFNLLNASGKLDIEKQFADLGVNAALSLPGATTTEQEKAALIALDTNWEEELLRNSIIQSNSLSISGGAEKFTYFLSVGYDKNSGIIDRVKGFERVTTRLNTTYQAKDWLNLGVGISLARSSTDLPRDRNNAQNPFVGLYTYNPYEPLFLRDATGNVVFDVNNNPTFNDGGNVNFPIARALQTEPDQRRNFLLVGNLFADMKLSDKFSNRFSVGATSNRFNRTQRSISGGVLDGFVGDANFPGTQTDTYNIDFEYNVNNIFTYSDTFKEFHNVSASFLLEYNENIFTDLFATSRGFPTPNIPFQNVAAEPTSVGSEERRRILFSQGLFLDYNYNSKYILSGSVRRDGSSRFGPGNKFGYFYSGSAAWNIASETFMEESIFNTLKLRASYGTSGNQNIGDFEFLNLLNFETYNGFSTAESEGVGNPNIQWESQATFDIGVEFGLFNNRINGVVDYFSKDSKDLLLNRPLSSTIGDEDNFIVDNIGAIKNSGVEVSLNANIITNENFKWSLGGNITFLDNEVKELVNGEDIITGTFGNLVLREGEEINSFYLVEYAGVDPTTGAPLYVDLNGNTTDTYSDSFQKLIKDKSPISKFEGGFYTSLNYKGFGLRSDFVYRSGNYILNLQRAAGVSIENIDGNLREEALNYWKQPGDTNVLPSPLFQNDADQSGTTRFLEKGDFIRLRTLTLDYNLSNKFLKNFSINSFRVFLAGQNLLTFTKFKGDPEIGLGSAESGEPGDEGFVPGEFSLFSYPQIRSYTFGLEVGF